MEDLTASVERKTSKEEKKIFSKSSLSSSRILVESVVIIKPLTSQDLDYISTGLVRARIP